MASCDVLVSHCVQLLVDLGRTIVITTLDIWQLHYSLSSQSCNGVRTYVLCLLLESVGYGQTVPEQI